MSNPDIIDLMYKVFDTETGKYWNGPRGKNTWRRTCDAKNSWNAQHTGWRRPHQRFNEQTRYEVHTFEVTFKRIK